MKNPFFLECFAKSRSLASLGMTVNGLFGNLLEHAPQLEKPFAVAGVADAATDKEWSQGRLRQQAGSHVVRELAGVCCAIHLAELVGSDRIDLFAHKRRQRKKVMQVAGPE